MQELLDNPSLFLIFLIISNVLMYIVTFLIGYLWSKLTKIKPLELTRKDVVTSLKVLITNIIVAYPGYLLYQNGYINFTYSGQFIRDIIVLYLAFDFLMYILHFGSHHVWPLRIFHNKHHSHHHFNEISLYVMEPIESIFFGLLLTVSAFLFTINFYSFITFIFINWLLGVLGHLNVKKVKKPVIFGNQTFHKTHHLNGSKNFGFYTTLWDRVFGTMYNYK